MTEKKRLLFIVNPISGTQNKRNLTDLIAERTDREKFDFELKTTAYAGHASELARSHRELDYDAIIAVGGDGTINEVARELVHSNVAFGVVPCGSGNGLARHLHIPMDVFGAIDVINRFEVKTLDYGVINGHPFFCTCGVGFDAFVSAKFAGAEKRGMLTYLENTLREGVRYIPDTYDIQIEGETMRYKAFLIACANASQYGNNVYIAPHASMSDGLMDVTIMEPFSMIEAPQIALQLFNRTLNNNSRIKTFRCKQLRIERSVPGVIHYDGDPTDSGNVIDVRLIAGGFKMIVNTKPDNTGAFSRIFSEIVDELIMRGNDVRRRNMKLLDDFNQQMRKHWKK